MQDPPPSPPVWNVWRVWTRPTTRPVWKVQKVQMVERVETGLYPEPEPEPEPEPVRCPVSSSGFRVTPPRRRTTSTRNPAPDDAENWNIAGGGAYDVSTI